MAAARAGHLAVVEWLQQEGADMNAKGNVSHILVVGEWGVRAHRGAAQVSRDAVNDEIMNSYGQK
jgi:hypothetical protein